MSKKNKKRTDKELAEQIFDNLRIADNKLCELAKQNPVLARFTAKVIMANNLEIYGVAMQMEIDSELDETGED